MPTEGVLGTFGDPAAAARAIRTLRERGYRVRAAMPAPFPEVVAALGKPRSRIDFVTLPGALLGLLFGAAFTSGTSLAWALVTGGKPIVSVPPFVVVTFELTVLFGSLTNLVAVSVGARRGASTAAFPLGAGDFNAALIGVHADAGAPADAEAILRGAGAEEVRRVA